MHLYPLRHNHPRSTPFSHGAQKGWRVIWAENVRAGTTVFVHIQCHRGFQNMCMCCQFSNSLFLTNEVYVWIAPLRYSSRDADDAANDYATPLPFSFFFPLLGTRSVVPRKQILKSPLLKTQSWQLHPFKAWSRSEYSHACFAYCQELLPCFYFYFPSPFTFIFMSKSSPYFWTASILAFRHFILKLKSCVIRVAANTRNHPTVMFSHRRHDAKEDSITINEINKFSKTLTAEQLPSFLPTKQTASYVCRSWRSETKWPGVCLVNVCGLASQ